MFPTVHFHPIDGFITLRYPTKKATELKGSFLETTCPPPQRAPNNLRRYLELTGPMGEILVLPQDLP